MSNEMFLQSITAIYAVCNGARLLSYVPQIIAVARENSGAHAISLISWIFWLLSHAATALYCATVVHDPLLAGMMSGNAVGCLGVVMLTTIKRKRYGWVRERGANTANAIESSPSWRPSRSAGRVAGQRL